MQDSPISFFIVRSKTSDKRGKRRLKIKINDNFRRHKYNILQDRVYRNVRHKSKILWGFVLMFCTFVCGGKWQLRKIMVSLLYKSSQLVLYKSISHTQKNVDILPNNNNIKTVLLSVTLHYLPSQLQPS